LISRPAFSTVIRHAAALSSLSAPSGDDPDRIVRQRPLQRLGYGGPAQPSPTIGQCLNGGYGWLEIECCRCKTRASLPLDAIRRARDTPIWKLEPSFRCRSCGTRRFKPPVRMIKLTERREVTPYKWVHPDEER